jgi:hypothetical protein
MRSCAIGLADTGRCNNLAARIEGRRVAAGLPVLSLGIDEPGRPTSLLPLFRCRLTEEGEVLFKAVFERCVESSDVDDVPVTVNRLEQLLLVAADKPLVFRFRLVEQAAADIVIKSSRACLAK